MSYVTSGPLVFVIIKLTRLTLDEGKMNFSSCWIVKLRNLHGIGIGAKERLVRINLTVSGGG
jgi:hypothetical protein